MSGNAHSNAASAKTQKPVFFKVVAFLSTLSGGAQLE